MFLNEQCRDAINMSDFLQSLDVNMSDLDYSKKNGLMKGISYLFMNGLKELNTFERPIHCTDIHKEILYIKDGNIWENNNSKKKLTEAINTLAVKQQKSLTTWEKNNPAWRDSKEGMDEYIQLVQTVMCKIDNEKIIQTIAKEVKL